MCVFVLAPYSSIKTQERRERKSQLCKWLGLCRQTMMATTWRQRTCVAFFFLSFLPVKKKRACGSTRWRQYSSENVDRTKKTHLKEGDCVCDTFFLSFLQIFVILLLGFSSSSSFGLGNDRRLSGASLKRQ